MVRGLSILGKSYLELPKTKENKEALKLHKEGKSKQRQGV